MWMLLQSLWGYILHIILPAIFSTRAAAIGRKRLVEYCFLRNDLACTNISNRQLLNGQIQWSDRHCHYEKSMWTFQASTYVIILAAENHDLIKFPVPSKSFVAVAMHAFFCKCYKANKNKKLARNLHRKTSHIWYTLQITQCIPLKIKKRWWLLKLFEKNTLQWI